MNSLPREYFANNYGTCLLGDDCKCVRNLASWLGTTCAQWVPTKATSFEELIQQAKKERDERGLKNGDR